MSTPSTNKPGLPTWLTMLLLTVAILVVGWLLLVGPFLIKRHYWPLSPITGHDPAPEWANWLVPVPLVLAFCWFFFGTWFKNLRTSLKNRLGW